MSRRPKPKKFRPSYISKSRPLPRDLGDRADGYFYASSGTGYREDSEVWKDFKRNYAGYYELGKSRAATASVNSTNVGLEEFNATTFMKPRFNSLIHSKEMIFNYPFLLGRRVLPEVAYPLVQRMGWQYYYRLSLAGATLDTVKDIEIPSWESPELDAIRRRAWWSMQPRFESKISLLNFVFEMKDFRSLGKMILQICRGGILQKLWHIRSCLVRMGKAQNALQAAQRTGSAATKIWAELILTLNFAIKPLLSDLDALYSCAKSVEELIQDEFVRRGHDSQKSHYSETLEERILSGSWGVNNNRIYFTGKRALSRFTATLEYSYTVKLRKGWELIRRIWGLDLNAEVIWNALPFSFLVDYFYQVGKAIRNMQLDHNVNSTMHQYCESLYSELFYGKAINTADSLVDLFYSPSYGGKGQELKIGFTPLAGAKATFYHRRIDRAPNMGTALPRPKGPSKQQLWNIAALVRSLMG